MTLADCFLYIKSDLFRYYGNVTMLNFIKAFFYNNGFIYSFWFRLSKIDNFFIKYFSMFILKNKSWKYGIQISPKVDCGYGLYIGHGMSIVINPSVKIGNNVNLSQFVTIGSNDGNAAVIGDNVYIGPNTCIIGKKNIGNDVIIGAGSIVTKDIPSFSVVAGNPFRIIKTIQINDVILNKWIVK
ncbi:serine O-acetyltransferase [Photobacterium leiognathi]|uniref:serine O-acetyltransferase n=1 Tax=Photobacterium leiognathi TaxID=553611 RepID=UPI002981C4EA|nr:serine acetyltransferase [Photobacterium leiognathi]